MLHGAMQTHAKRQSVTRKCDSDVVALFVQHFSEEALSEHGEDTFSLPILRTRDPNSFVALDSEATMGGCS
jgi:hypothetical protein